MVVNIALGIVLGAFMLASIVAVFMYLSEWADEAPGTFAGICFVISIVGFLFHFGVLKWPW